MRLISLEMERFEKYIQLNGKQGALTLIMLWAFLQKSEMFEDCIIIKKYLLGCGNVPQEIQPKGKMEIAYTNAKVLMKEWYGK